MDTYPEQPQIDSKSVDLQMPGPSARDRGPSAHDRGPSAHDRGPSGPATTGRIFNELPRHAPEPPHMAQNLN
jgi:hypothetical protein